MPEPLRIDPDARLDEANPADGRACRVRLPRFFCSRYPVTVGQWRCFMDAVEKRQWTPRRPDGAVMDAADFDVRAGQRPATAPVVFVNWYEAVAYCVWLTVQLRRHRDTPEPLATLLRVGERRARNRRWVLAPISEAEWEKVSRGDDLRRFPWGEPDDVELNLVNGLRHHPDPEALTEHSAVGAFAAGQSSYAVEELAGNVWEWTRSTYGDYPYPNGGDRAGRGRERLDDRREPSRVVRGGSFGDVGGALRCVDRYHLDPSIYFGIHCGLRVVASPFYALETLISEHSDL